MSDETSTSGFVMYETIQLLKLIHGTSDVSISQAHSSMFPE